MLTFFAYLRDKRKIKYSFSIIEGVKGGGGLSKSFIYLFKFRDDLEMNHVLFFYLNEYRDMLPESEIS